MREIKSSSRQTRISKTAGGWRRSLVGLLLTIIWGLSSFYSTVFAEETAKVPVKQQVSDSIYQQLLSGKRIPSNKSYQVPEQPTVYLTFDDGPSKLTGKVLDILKEERVPATFFVLGQLAEQQPALIKRIAAEGHSLGNHSYNHVYKEMYKDFDTFWDQVQRTDQVLEKILGQRTTLLRAPGGTSTNFDAFYYYYLEQAGYTVFDWNVDTRDAVKKGVSADEIVQQVRSSTLQHELTVLMHDGAGHEETVKALPEIISYYRGLGYSFAALTDSVRPRQFGLVKSKWPRVYTEAGFKRTTLAAAEVGLERESQRLKQENPLRLASTEASGRTLTSPSDQVVKAAVSSVMESSKEAVLPPLLSIHLGSKKVWQLEPSQYGFETGRFTVPLEGLVRQLGGFYQWNENSKVATVQYGALHLEVDPVNRRIYETWLGRSTTIHYLSDVSWKGQMLQVPLRATVNLLGGRITGYSLSGQERTVVIELREEPTWVQRVPFLAILEKNELYLGQV